VTTSSREASVKLTLDSGQYLVEMRKVGDAVDTEQKKASKSAGLWGAGVSKVGSNFAALGGAIRNVVGLAASLSGAFSVGVAIQKTIALEGELKNLATGITDGGQKLQSWKELQQDAMATASKWSQSNEDVAKSMSTLEDAVSDLDFTRGVIDEIAKQSTRTGKPMSVLTEIVGSLNEQFGITKEEVPAALQAVIEGGNKGGVTVEQLAAQFEKVGPAAQLAGLRGREGLSQVLGMLNTVEGSVKKPFIAVSKFLDKFADPLFHERAKKEIGVDLVGKDGDPNKALEKLMQKTRGAKDQLAKVLVGEELKVAIKLGESFAKEFDQATGTVAQKTEAATIAFNKSLTSAGEAAKDAAQIEAEAQERLNEPQAKMKAAMNELTAAIAQPEIIDALHELAAIAPELAKQIAGLIKWVAKNPLMAGLGAGGLAVGGSFLQGAAGAAADTFMKRAFAGSAATAAGSSFAAAAFGPLAIAAAGLAIGAAVGMAVQDKMEAADAGRRKRAATELRAELADDFKKTGKQRELSEKEKLVLAEGGEVDGEAPTGTDLGKTRAKFQRDQARRAELKAMGVDLGPEGEDVLRVGALGAANMSKQGLLGEGKSPELIKFGSDLTQALAGVGTLPGGKAAPEPGPRKVEIVDGEPFAASLRRSVLRVEVVNPTGDATRGPIILPAPAPK
jgi:hypothetical protein